MNGSTRSYEFAKRLVLSGHEVHMITSQRNLIEDGMSYIENVDDIKVYWLYVPYDNSFSYIKRILAFIKFIFLSTKVALRINCDVVLASSTPLTVAIPAILYKKINKVPMVFEVRDLWPEIPVAIGAIKSKLLIFLAKFLEKSAYRNSKYVIALSPGMKNGIEKAGMSENSIIVIPNSCDTNLFNVSASRGLRFIDENSFLRDKKVVIYAGTFGYINGVSYLVDLSKEMSKINKNIYFLAVGDGKENKKLYDLARKEGVLNNNFFIMKPVAKNKMPELLSAATICASLFKPYKEMWNNSANKFFDGLAAGKPIMINYQGWQSKLLNETGSGITVSYDNISNAAKSLNNFISDDEKLRKASLSSANLAKEKFNRDKLYSLFEKTLINATKKRSESY